MNFVKHYLSEKSLGAIDFSDVVDNDYYKNLFDSDNGDRYREEFALITDTDKDDIDEDEFKHWVREMVEERWEEAVYDIDEKISNNKIEIYRVMRVGKDYISHLIKQGNHLGVYWSWDRGAAEAHWGDFSKSNEALFVVEVNENTIDWTTTLQANIDYSTGDEKEITLFKGTPIKIKEMWMNDEQVDISKLKDKTFKA